MTQQNEFKKALAWLDKFEPENPMIGSLSVTTHICDSGESYEAIKTMRRYVKIAEKLMQEPSDEMITVLRGHFPIGPTMPKQDAADMTDVFCSVCDQLLKEVEGAR